MGGKMNKSIEIIPVSELFVKSQYIVPIYQRNFTWNEQEIVQLIEDIESSITDSKSTYYLGNLIVNERQSTLYEVIDGQQRLTTIYLIQKYLGSKILKGKLSFEAREKSNYTLINISEDRINQLIVDEFSPEILNGFKIIENHFKKTESKDIFKDKLDQVLLIRVPVPKNIDLNHYFEIMNTRGEQLELHEIAKAKLIGMLDNEHDKKVAALIWENCSNMNSYVQLNFSNNERRKIFSNDFSHLNPEIKNFNSLTIFLKNKDIPEADCSKEKNTLINILKSPQHIKKPNKQTEEEKARFESVLSFPNFLLQVNAVLKEKDKEGKEEDAGLDDKYLLESLEWTWKNQEEAKSFLFKLLKIRILFDKFILKREFAQDYKENGKWSLQRLKKENDSYNYLSTLNTNGIIKTNQQLKTLQSCLRITYTSPKTMHWITIVLSKVLIDENHDIISLLEDYCKLKVRESDYKNKLGFKLERIVFSYLDYLLYREGYYQDESEVIKPLSDDWHFQFRNSVEHFFPQNPHEGDKWEKEKDLHGFGNLALISVSGNARFSNLDPIGKIKSFNSVINQSLKLIIMKNISEDNNGWTKELSQKHKDEMFKVLDNDLKY